MLIAVTLAIALAIQAIGASQGKGRCAESSAAHRQASARLERLDARIERLKSSDPVAEVVKELHGLLGTECFLAAAEAGRVPAPDTAVSLKEWWGNGGGGAWLASFLKLPRLGPIERLASHVVVPADVRKTLDLDAHPEHPLAALLCSSSDTACGAQTRGWTLRADACFDDYRALGRNLGPGADEPRRPASAAAISRACAVKVSRAKALARWKMLTPCRPGGR